MLGEDEQSAVVGGPSSTVVSDTVERVSGGARQ
jgi:hypothetical protein